MAPIQKVASVVLSCPVKGKLSCFVISFKGTNLALLVRYLMIQISVGRSYDMQIMDRSIKMTITVWKWFDTTIAWNPDKSYIRLAWVFKIDRTEVPPDMEHGYIISLNVSR